MGYKNYLSEFWKAKSTAPCAYLNRLRAWECRQQPEVLRIPTPTRPEKASALGYKATPAYTIIRVHAPRIAHKRDTRKGKLHRKPRNCRVYKSLDTSRQVVAEQKVGAIYTNLRVMGSYWIAEDGIAKYFEVVLADPHNKALRN